MGDAEIKIACLELAVKSTGGLQIAPSTALEKAKQFYDWVVPDNPVASAHPRRRRGKEE